MRERDALPHLKNTSFVEIKLNPQPWIWASDKLQLWIVLQMNEQQFNSSNNVKWETEVFEHGHVCIICIELSQVEE